MPNSDWRPYTLTLPTRAHDPIDFSQQNQGYPTRKPKHDLVVDVFVSFSSEVIQPERGHETSERDGSVDSVTVRGKPTRKLTAIDRCSPISQRQFCEASMAAPLALAIPIHIQIGDISRRDSLVCLAKLIYAAYDTSSRPRLETMREPRILGSTRTLRKSLSPHKNLFAAAATRLRKIGLVISWLTS